MDGKSGLGLIRPKIVIDASGDADVCALAQVPFEKAGDIDPAQTLTTTFKLANVDVQQLRSFREPIFSPAWEKRPIPASTIYHVAKEAFISLRLKG